MKSKKTNPFVITTLIFFMTTVMFGLLTTGVIIKYRKSTVATNTDKLSNDIRCQYQEHSRYQNGNE